jgi:uncharacterized protein involved in tellurium resistance
MSLLTINLIVWGVILILTIVLWLYRRFLENREDHYIHLHGDDREAKALQTQSVVGKRVETLSRTTRILVIVLVVYGLVIAGFEIYRAWNNTGG